MSSFEEAFAQGLARGDQVGAAIRDNLDQVGTMATALAGQMALATTLLRSLGAPDEQIAGFITNMAHIVLTGGGMPDADQG